MAVLCVKWSPRSSRQVGPLSAWLGRPSCATGRGGTVPAGSERPFVARPLRAFEVSQHAFAPRAFSSRTILLSPAAPDEFMDIRPPYSDAVASALKALELRAGLEVEGGAAAAARRFLSGDLDTALDLFAFLQAKLVVAQRRKDAAAAEEGAGAAVGEQGHGAAAAEEAAPGQRAQPRPRSRPQSRLGGPSADVSVSAADTDAEPSGRRSRAPSSHQHQQQQQHPRASSSAGASASASEFRRPDPRPTPPASIPERPRSAGGRAPSRLSSWALAPGGAAADVFPLPSALPSAAASSAQPSRAPSRGRARAATPLSERVPGIAPGAGEYIAAAAAAVRTRPPHPPQRKRCPRPGVTSPCLSARPRRAPRRPGRALRAPRGPSGGPTSPPSGA